MAAHERCCTGGQVVPAGPQDPSLDKFFAQHNSEDNKSFAELMQVSRERLRKAKPWLFKNHNPPQIAAGLLTDAQTTQPLAITAPTQAFEQSLTNALVTSDSDISTFQASGQVTVQTTASNVQASTAPARPAADTDGFGTTGQQSSTLTSWPHTNKSALYYDSSQRDVVPWSEAELADMVQGPPKQIKHSATRFPSGFDSRQDSTAGAAAPQPGVVRDYGVLNTPSFVPGVDQSPLMTWGDIGSTPIRLDEDDDIHVSAAAGKGHSLPCVCKSPLGHCQQLLSAAVVIVLHGLAGHDVRTRGNVKAEPTVLLSHLPLSKQYSRNAGSSCRKGLLLCQVVIHLLRLALQCTAMLQHSCCWCGMTLCSLMPDARQS